jgi:MFS family permease
MAIFVAGWATGGLIFGAVGDRIGRAKTLALTVLIYSVFTGLSSFAATSRSS